jgi:hypothetical protein
MNAFALFLLFLCDAVRMQPTSSSSGMTHSDERNLRVKSASSPTLSWNDRSLQSGTWNTITYDDFEASFGSFGTVASTRDAKRDGRSRYASQGSYSAMIRDNSGEDSSVFQVADNDVTGYSDLRVSFVFYARGLKGDEAFFLDYSSDGGSTWLLVKQYMVGRDFESDEFTEAQVVFSQQEGSFLLTTTGKIRFLCDAKDNRDKVYIDEVLLEGLLSIVEPTDSPSPAPSMSPTKAPSRSPTLAPSVSETPSSTASYSPTSPLTREDICPLDRRNVPAKYEILPYTDIEPDDGVEDDLSEISYLAFSDQTDANGNRFAYAASDKEQFSLKVIQFTDNVFAAHLNGLGNTVATYTLNLTDVPLNDDWEDISLGPCTDSNANSVYTTDQVCIYIGNTGNNPRTNYVQRKVLKIFKFLEPIIVNGTPQDCVVNVTTIEFQYAQGFNQDPDTYYDGTLWLIICQIPDLFLFVHYHHRHSHLASTLMVLHPSRGHVCRLGRCYW